MKDQCVIYYGPIQTREEDGVFHQEGLGTLLDKIFLNTKYKPMIQKKKHTSNSSIFHNMEK
jgi:hypothetical protein